MYLYIVMFMISCGGSNGDDNNGGGDPPPPSPPGNVTLTAPANGLSLIHI